MGQEINCPIVLDLNQANLACCLIRFKLNFI